LAGIEHLAKILPAGAHILVNLSGRGDKDMETAAKYFGLMGDK
jgi:tryptophan synthase beta chain